MKILLMFAGSLITLDLLVIGRAWIDIIKELIEKKK